MEGSSLVGMARGSNGRNGGIFGKTPPGVVESPGRRGMRRQRGAKRWWQGGVTHHVACAQLCIPPCVQCQRRGNGTTGVIHAAATSARTGVTCRRALDAFAGGSGGGGERAKAGRSGCAGDRAKAGRDGGGDRAKAGSSLP